ncbi:hypothetical protein E1A91_A08G097400v1 [Gossypium mustelinum]|uniref:Decapping nuclease n=1 Tax=Gossypium mustelinum TaxID=34275 RepID=A0A5D2Y7C5_GOSMU|nr:hypothetical protein E1A91_A08G097400v1 [Gossypium mustelinum]
MFWCRDDAGRLVRTERLRTKDIAHRVKMKNYWQGGVCLAFADEVLCWLYGTVKESKILISISTSTIWAAQKAVTKAKYEWEQAFTLMKELKLKPPLLTFRAWIWATGTILRRLDDWIDTLIILSGSIW